MCGCPADYTAMGEQARDLNKRHRIKTKIINVVSAVAIEKKDEEDNALKGGAAG